MEKKEIRIINNNYQELFRLKNGDILIVTLADGSKMTRKCWYVDDYHFRFGNGVYHIKQFAEVLEKTKATCQPFFLTDTSAGAVGGCR